MAPQPPPPHPSPVPSEPPPFRPVPPWAFNTHNFFLNLQLHGPSLRLTLNNPRVPPPSSCRPGLHLILITHLKPTEYSHQTSGRRRRWVGCFGRCWLLMKPVRASSLVFYFPPQLSLSRREPPPLPPPPSATHCVLCAVPTASPSPEPSRSPGVRR